MGICPYGFLERVKKMKIMSLVLAFISLFTTNTATIYETTVLEEVTSEHNTVVKEDEEKHSKAKITYFDYSNENAHVVFPYVWSLDRSVVNKWLAEMEYEECFFEEKDTPWAIKKEQYSLYLGENDRKTFVFADESWYLLTQNKWYKVSGFTKPSDGKKLTMEKLIEICETSETLGWSNFEEYESQSIGSGLMILSYYINEDYEFLIGGTGGEPVYMRLWSIEDNTYIDVREESIKEFIK